VTDVATIDPIISQTARSVLSAIAENGTSRSRPGMTIARFASATRPKVRHQRPWTS
jgi:hypothetical protein